MALPRILYAVPPLRQVHFEIAKAIQAFAAADNKCSEPRVTPTKVRSDFDPIAEIVRDAWKILCKGRYDANEPRVPAGNPDGGQWTKGGEGDPRSESEAVLSDETPDNDWIPGAQYAANNPPGIGHNQGPPLGEPPEIPLERPATKQAINAILKAAAYWLGDAALAGEPVGDLILALQATSWLSNYLSWIHAYLDPPKSLPELQQDALSPAPGYNIHHIVEQTPAAQDDYPWSIIDSPENLVRIPTLVHWEITAWYQTKSPNYGDMSPRNYLRGRSWEERRRVGIDALVRFGVLTP